MLPVPGNGCAAFRQLHSAPRQPGYCDTCALIARKQTPQACPLGPVANVEACKRQTADLRVIWDQHITALSQCPSVRIFLHVCSQAPS